MNPGRNAPCHCGSGKKWKKCCMGRDERTLPLRARLAAIRFKTATELGIVVPSLDYDLALGQERIKSIPADCYRVTQ